MKLKRFENFDTDPIEKIELFLSKFTDSPESWKEATGELADLHRRIAEIYNERTGKEYKNHEGISKNPKESIERHKKGIRQLFPLLNEIDQEYIIDHFSTWFKNV